jgi:hypothetical protein
MGAHVRHACGIRPRGGAELGILIKIGSLENESREISGEMDDMLA